MQVHANHVKAYNSLPTVFYADLAMQRNDRDAVIESLLEVIVDYGLQSAVGLRLLHRHNEIYGGEVMLEEASIDASGLALITAAASATSVDSTVSANSWMLEDESFVPMEYSRSVLLQYPELSPKSHPEFFSALKTRLIDLKLERWIGPALIESTSITAHANERKLLLEQNALDDRASVLRFIFDHEVEATSVVETFWVASIETATKNTPTVKAPKKIKTIKKVCTRICPSVQNPPVHQGTFIHS